jgi:glycosyltransferase involved in cell wall biosynthesis
MTSKTALVLNSNFLDQDSVNTIGKNLFASYSLIENINYSLVVIENLLISEIKTLIKEKAFSYCIVLHPLIVVNEKLKTIINLLPIDTSIVFHVYGDFIRKASFYLSLDGTLRGRKVLFLAASRAYERLLENNVPKENIGLLPFPVDTSLFSVSAQKRRDFRKKHGVGKGDVVLLYTGRISPQKNVHFLISAFHKVTQVSLRKYHLFIVGNCDDFERPTYSEKYFRPGEYFIFLKNIIANLSVKNIHFVPKKTHRNLIEFYNGSDSFISLSLYHDEDFGYAPLEALVCGTPAILTSWGGFKDFKLALPPFVSTIPVHFLNDELVINNEKQLSELLLNIKSCSREAVAGKTKKIFSIQQIAIKLENLLFNDLVYFGGFKQEFLDFVVASMVENNCNLDLYKNNYSSFWLEEIE